MCKLVGGGAQEPIQTCPVSLRKFQKGSVGGMQHFGDLSLKFDD